MPEWENFLTRSTALFEDVVDRNDIDDELFVHQLASFAASVTDVPWAPTQGNKGLGPDINIGPIDTGQRRGFFLLRWEFGPNAVLPPHNHPNYSFATLCVEGEMRIQNFEITDTAPQAYDSPEPFTVRRTQDQLVANGRINTLTRRRDYIHRLQAGPTGAVGMDIGILHSQDVGFSYLALEHLKDDLFRARWDRELTKRVRGK